MIKPNAVSDELSSPFFLKNEETCKEWEKLARDNDGEIEGSYNSWSYKLLIKIDSPRPLRIIVSRATYSNGALLISAQDQNLHDPIEIKTKINSDEEFVIKKPAFKDFFSGKKMGKLKVNPYYTVLGRNTKTTYSKVSTVLSDQFKHKLVHQVNLDQGLLTIVLNDINNEFELIKTLIHTDFDQE